MRKLQIRNEKEYKLAQRLRKKLMDRALEIRSAMVVIKDLVPGAEISEVAQKINGLKEQIYLIDELCEEWFCGTQPERNTIREHLSSTSAFYDALCNHRRSNFRRPLGPDEYIHFDEYAEPVVRSRYSKEQAA